MKKFYLLILTLLFAVSIKAQEGNKESASIGISYSSFGRNDVIYFQTLDGAPSYNSKHFYALGINYIYPVNNWLKVETGIEYARHTVEIIPNLPPNVDVLPYIDNFSLLEIPLSARIDFLNYFYINGGLFIDFNLSPESRVDSQSGLGANLGCAVKYDFKFGLSLYVNPYIKAHSLVPFAKENYQVHLMENGFRFGVSYKLKKN